MGEDLLDLLYSTDFTPTVDFDHKNNAEEEFENDLSNFVFWEISRFL